MPRKKKTEIVEVDDYSPLKVGFTGTRKGMTAQQLNALRGLLAELIKGHHEWHAHHGDCVGADAEFHALAVELGASVTIYPPSDNKLRANCKADFEENPQPYSKRNKNIVEDSDLVIAAPVQSNNPGYGGTWQTIRFAQDADKLYRIVLPNGAVVEP